MGNALVLKVVRVSGLSFSLDQARPGDIMGGNELRVKPDNQGAFHRFQVSLR